MYLQFPWHTKLFILSEESNKPNEGRAVALPLVLAVSMIGIKAKKCQPQKKFLQNCVIH